MQVADAVMRSPYVVRGLCVSQTLRLLPAEVSLRPRGVLFLVVFTAATTFIQPMERKQTHGGRARVPSTYILVSGCPKQGGDEPRLREGVAIVIIVCVQVA